MASKTLDAEAVLTFKGEPITSWRYDKDRSKTFARGHLAADQITAELDGWDDERGGVLDETQGGIRHLWITFDEHAEDCDEEPVDDGWGCFCHGDAQVFDLGDIEAYQREVAEGTPGAVPVSEFWVFWP